MVPPLRWIANIFVFLRNLLWILVPETIVYCVEAVWLVYRHHCRKRVPISHQLVINPVVVPAADINVIFLLGHSSLSPITLVSLVGSGFLLCLWHTSAPVSGRGGTAFTATITAISVILTSVGRRQFSNMFLHGPETDGCLFPGRG